MTPRITVLIPAWNAERTLREALLSVLNQDMPLWECVVVDDGSSDGTVGVVQACQREFRQGDKITLVQLDHGGCAHATHAGILRAQTDVVTILDSDDLLYPHALRTVLEHFTDEVCYLWTQFNLGPRPSQARKGWTRPTPLGYSLRETFLKTGWWNGSHQRAFRRSVYLDETPGLDQRWQHAVDLQTCLLLAETGRPTKHVPTVTYFYRKHRPQMSATRRAEQSAAHKQMVAEYRQRCLTGAAS